MRLRTELSEEDISQGFSAENDIFGRKDTALRLTEMFEKLEHGSVCLLDGRWGTGKSTFVRQWKVELERRNIPSIYFDAFASDYLESPFEAIAGMFIAAARQARRANQPAYHNFLSKAAAVGKAIASVSAKVGVKAVTLGAVSAAELNDFSAIGDTLADGLGEVTEEGVKRLLESHADREAQFDELRRAIIGLPRLLQPIQDERTSAPLIVFIEM
jgi:hypothetical protein